ncbi:MAG: amidohydrolase family protein [Alphaproteobacteria bacterium]|nr:amidohydrolase family protein [Alphaproteobacteria bacterium]
MAAERRVVYMNARLLDPASGLDETGALLTVGGKIWDAGAHLFADGVTDGSEIVDCRGMCLAPGFVDMQVFLNEPVETTARAAAAGGVTTIAVMPNMNPVLDRVSLVDYIERLARDASVRIHPIAAATKELGGEEMTEIGLLRAAGALAFSDGRRAIADAQVMRRVLTYAHAHEALVIQHAEEPALAREGVMNEGEMATRLGLPGVPAEAEVIMIERDLRLVALTGGRYHVALVTTQAGVEAIRRAKVQGLPVTCGTAPHYFALNELAVEAYRTFARTSPPLRAEADRRAVVEGLADGTIDVIVSSHDPHDVESKRLPFDLAASGVIGLETLLPTCMELLHGGHVPMMRLLDALTVRPAAILGLSVGALAKGQPADLVLFDPNAPGRIDPDTFHSKAKNSPFEGRPIQGKVLRTVVGGRAVYQAG